MKSFFKNVLANIVAYAIIVMFAIMAIVLLVVSSAISDNSSVKVKKNSILTLDFKTKIIDAPTEDAGSILFSNNEKVNNVMLYDVLTAIKHAKTDVSISGISIETDQLGAGITQIDDVRAALEDFKKSGKFVYAYGNSVSQATYYLGSVADKYYLHPAGGIELKGMASEIIFLKGFLEKYGIGVDVIRHGKYKAAVEPYLREDISDENREQMSVLLTDIWSKISQSIQKSRALDSTQFKTAVDSLYGVIPELSLKSKLADGLIQKGQYDDLLKTKLKLGKDDKLSKVNFSNYLKSFNVTNDHDHQVAVLYASGSIYSGEGYQDIFSKDYIKYIRKLAEDENVKAVVLRVNSPGGSANASDEILFELQELRKKKPLVVSFGDYAASGGYYISMAADRIFSEPNTLTGSIGVFGVVYNFKEIANKNGVRSDVVATNINSQMYSPFQGLTPGGHQIISKSVEGTYKRFVHFVSANRKKSFQQIDEVGGGRVWSGSHAKKLGLVDEVGSLNDAIGAAAKMAQLKDYAVGSYPQKKSKFELLFDDLDANAVSTKVLKSQLGENQYRLMEMISDTKKKGSIMMEMPYKVSF